MSGPSGLRSVVTEAFSATAFFRDCAAGELSESSGVLRTSISIPPHQQLSGKAPEPGGSLVWIDGLAHHVQAAQAVVGTLREGAIPRPLRQRGHIPGDLQAHFTDAAQIADSEETLLALFSRQDSMAQAFCGASLVDCPSCSAPIKLFLRPHDMCLELLDRFRGQAVEICVRSVNEELLEWAENMGLEAARTTVEELSVRIDAGVVDEKMINALMPVLQSAWQIRGACLNADSGSAHLRLAIPGVCPACGASTGTVSAKKVQSLVSRGAQLATDCPLELGLRLGALSLREALSLTFDADPFPVELEAAIPQELRDLLKRLGLGRCQLGIQVRNLSTPALAAVAAAKCLLPSKGLALIDLPHGVISKPTVEVLERALASRAATAPTVLVGHSLSSHCHVTEHWGSDAKRGAPVAIAQFLGMQAELHRGVTALPAYSADTLSSVAFGLGSIEPLGPASISAIRVFDSFSLKRKTVAEELGLYDPLARLVASSIGARTLGRSAKAFALRTRSEEGLACPRCAGLGVLLESAPGLARPLASRCDQCEGSRFRGEAVKIVFRGLSIGQILNSTFSAMADVLRALPKSSRVLELVNLLGLERVPLGMPLCLLSFSERRRMQILLAALESQSSRNPSVVLLELPYAGLTETHAHAVEKLLCGRQYAPNTAWVVCTHADQAATARNN